MNGRPSILLVEDNFDYAQVLQRCLSRWGADVTTLSDVHDSLQAVGTCAFDAAIVECGFLGSGDIALLKAVRRRQPDAPIVAMSTYTHPEVARRAVQAGANRYLTKPFALPELKAAIERILNPMTLTAPGPGGPRGLGSRLR
jgi:two-component system OmpR family response regulator/two-component system response regulator TctD